MSIVDYLFEIGILKKVKRSGWWFAKIKDPESVAEHVQRAAVIGFILGKIEKVNAEKCALLVLFHDNHETRILDLHKVADRYLEKKKAEVQAHTEQIKQLPTEIGKEILSLFTEYENQQSKEAIIARDADLLECAITAKEYIEIGYQNI